VWHRATDAAGDLDWAKVWLVANCISKTFLGSSPTEEEAASVHEVLDLRRGTARKLTTKPAINNKSQGRPSAEGITSRALFKLESRISHYLRRTGTPVCDWTSGKLIEISNLGRTISSAYEGLIEADGRPALTTTGRLFCKEALTRARSVVSAARKSFAEKRFLERTSKWVERMHDDWKRSGARSYSKYFKNDHMMSRASFRNPSNDDKLTSNPEEIMEISTSAWTQVFTRPPESPAPD
jgi:hypothetical protein